MQLKVLQQLFIVVELAFITTPSGSAHWAGQAEGEAGWGERVWTTGRESHKHIESMVCIKINEIVSKKRKQYKLLQ